jgi:hypothetical protein
LTLDSSGQFSTSDQITGQALADDYGNPIQAELRTHVELMDDVYTLTASKASTETVAGPLGGRTFGPGVVFSGAAMSIDTDVTLQGTADDVFVFQTDAALGMAAGIKVILLGGAQAKNVFWQVGGAVTIGANGEMKGIILSKTAVTFGLAATLVGNIYAQTAVTLNGNTITQADTCPG